MTPEKAKGFIDTLIEALPDDPRDALSVLAMAYANVVVQTGCDDRSAFDALSVSLGKFRVAALSEHEGRGE